LRYSHATFQPQTNDRSFAVPPDCERFNDLVVSQIPVQPQIPAMKGSIDIPPANAPLDPNIYSVPFCELIKDPERVDGKLIRMQAIFDNGVDWAHIRDGAIAYFSSNFFLQL
jgi:hypothetical protein